MTSNRDQLATTIEIPSIKPGKLKPERSGPNNPYRSKMRANLSADDNAARAPPLDISVNSEVTVINGDRSNLTWKRYKLIDINQRTGMCVVEGISDSRQRNFPRSVVKPKEWIDSFKALFRAMAAADADEKEEKEQHQHHYVEYHNFYQAMQLLGAEYDHPNCLKIFKALDVRANGILSFGQFLNWAYGLGRTADKGRLLTTIECMTGLRKWQNTLTYYVMSTDDAGNEEGNGGKQTIWSTAQYDAAQSTADTVQLVTIASGGDDDQPNVFQIPKNLVAFSQEFQDRVSSIPRDEVYSPSNEDERECSIVVMGPGEIGKSALINKFVKGIFPHDYDPTIQDHARKQILVDDKPALLDILDTAGQDEFASMRYDWLKDGIDILLICFSRSDHESFIRAEELINISKRLLRQQKTPKIVPILLVGTKKDLAEQMMQVTLDDIQDLRDRYGGDEFIGYEECSAFMDEGVSEIFEYAVTMYRKWRNEQAGIKIKHPTLRELQQRARQGSYVQQINNMNIGSRGRTKCVMCLAKFCPALAAYMEPTDTTSEKLKIASVPKDKFGDELAEPSYSKQHFFVYREFSLKRMLYCITAAFLFPLVITLQTALFVFYCNSTNCCFKLLREDQDFTDSQVQIMYDFFSVIVGRDPRETAKSDDARKWFLSQTCGQKLARVFFTIVIDTLFFFVFYNATYGFGWFEGDEGEESDLAIIETLGPGQLWGATWFILTFYMSLDIDVKPDPPSMQALRPYVMYLNFDESLRTTAYVFLRGFSKSTFAIFRLEATSGRIITSAGIAVIWILIPGVVRIVFGADGGGKFIPENLLLPTVSAMFVGFFFMFALILGLQMQLMSGLVKYIDWINDLTSMLDEVFSKEKGLHYINLTRHNNTLAWLEMRTYLYTKGLIIFSRQEIFVVYIVFLQIATAMYILYRLMSPSGTDRNNTYGSPSFVGILFVFLLLTYSLVRILRTTRMIERLQTKQIALLAAQKFQIYYKRITWHPDKDSENELSEGGDDYDPDWADIDPKNLPPLDDPVEDSTDDDLNIEEEQGRVSPVDGAKSENAALLGAKDDDAAPIDSQQTFESINMGSGGSPNLGYQTQALRTVGPTRLRLQRTATNARFNNLESESMFSAEYLEQSEKFVQAAINICQAQDIIPRIFNIKVQVAVGLSILCTACAVIPTAARLSFGSDCAAWQS